MSMRQFRGLDYSQDDIVSMLNAVEEARDVMIGTREWRTAHPGKMYFESSPRAKCLNNAKRCYGLNSMVQQPRQVEGPPAALKTANDQPDEDQHNIRAYLQVTMHLVSTESVPTFLSIGFDTYQRGGLGKTRPSVAYRCVSSLR
jgi:hypothetical protein